MSLPRSKVTVGGSLGASVKSLESVMFGDDALDAAELWLDPLPTDCGATDGEGRSGVVLSRGFGVLLNICMLGYSRYNRDVTTLQSS